MTLDFAICFFIRVRYFFRLNRSQGGGRVRTFEDNNIKQER